MKYFAMLIGQLVAIVTWLAGIVLAKGTGATIAAICIPFYAWYLVVERAMQLLRII